MKVNFKTFFILCAFLFSFSFADETIQASIKYNETTARLEAFKDVQKKIPKDFYKAYLKDKNKEQNLEFIAKNQFDTGLGRTLCPFYLNTTLASYSIYYYETPKYSFYYNILGSLVKFDIMDKIDYPMRTLGYSRYGNLISVSFAVSENEQFVYDEDGKLIAHWIDGVAYDKNNKIPKVLKLQRKYNEN